MTRIYDYQAVKDMADKTLIIVIAFIYYKYTECWFRSILATVLKYSKTLRF